MADPEEFVQDILRHAGAEDAIRADRVSRQFADERIQEKIERVEEPRQREGLQAVDRVLKEREVPDNLRLHLISAVVQLGRIAEETLPARQESATRK